MFKIDFIESVAEKCGVAPSVADKVINAAINTIQEQVAAGESVQITGFGTFKKSKIAAHTAKGFDGVEHKIPEKNTVVFSAGSFFKKALNPPKRKRGRPKKNA